MQLSTAKLERLMVWAGDHHPSEDVVERCFCVDNWGNLKQKLEAAIKDAHLDCIKQQLSQGAHNITLDIV